MNWLSLLTGIPGIISDYLKGNREAAQQKIELEKAKNENELKVELARGQLAGEIAKAEFEKSKTIIKATGQWFKYFTFFMWFGPFMVGVVYPAAARDIFDNLGTMPEWYVQSCMLIMFTVWGISVSAPVVSNIFNGLGTFFNNRKEQKQEFALKKQILINRKAFFDALRVQQGVVSPEDVKKWDLILDDVDKRANEGI